ncbi:MAG: TatD family hydrolase [Lentisphaeria bacterium]|nr:TatD family hydrolase [Lentisphaeria bacterium]
MDLFDTHFHFYSEETPEAFCALVKSDFNLYMMAVGGNFEESLKAQTFAQAIENSVFAAGVHPQSAIGREQVREFEIFRHAPKLAAVGELGLDYYYEAGERKVQREVFESFLALALEWNLPAIVHCRDKDEKFDAYEDCYAMLKDFSAAGGRFVVHCFTGTAAWGEKFLELGGYLGVTGIVTFNKAGNVRDNLKIIPFDRLLLESDSPYLSPVPFRGKPNHPSYTIKTAVRVASELGKSLDSVAAQTTANAMKFYNFREVAGK